MKVDGDRRAWQIVVRARHFGVTMDFRRGRGGAARRLWPQHGDDGRASAQIRRLYIQGGPYTTASASASGRRGGIADHRQALLTAPFYPPEQLVKGMLINGTVPVSSETPITAAPASRSPTSQMASPISSSMPTFLPIRAGPSRPTSSWSTALSRSRRWSRGSSCRRVAGATLKAYNQFAAAGEDPTFGKHPDWLKPLNPPFAAFDLSSAARFIPASPGGLRVTADGEVLTERNRVIRAYAAGRASTLAQDSYGYASGLSLGEPLFRPAGGVHAACRYGGAGHGELTVIRRKASLTLFVPCPVVKRALTSCHDRD